MIAIWDAIKTDPRSGWEKGDYHDLFLKADPHNVIGHARAIFDHSDRRKLILLMNEASRKCYDCQCEPHEIRTDVETQLREFSEAGADDVIRLGSLIPEVIEDYERRRQGISSGLITPWPSLNGMTDGLQNGELIILAGRTSMGKSALSLALFAHASVNLDEPCLFVSLEMNNRSLIRRIMTSYCGINSQDLLLGCDLSHEDFGKLELAQETIGPAPLFVHKKPKSSITQIIAKARAVHARFKLKLVIVDHLQMVRSDDPSLRNSAEKIGDNVAQLKTLAVDLDVPVVLLSQINRDVKDRADHRPQLFDLKGSGGIEEHADVAILIHRKDYYDPSKRNENIPDVTEINVAKNRNGPTGEFTLDFNLKTGRFEEPQDVPAFGDGPIY